MRVGILFRVLSRLSVNRLPQRLFKLFYSYLIATSFGLSDGHLQVNRTNYSKMLRTIPTTDPLCFSINVNYVCKLQAAVVVVFAVY
jgi:nitroimidazol reductase NimA-like FMN-containing flavoprotein (pyridoxamine 5'-phosphate oxidase superfamily)